MTLVTEIQEVAGQYPDRRSAILPALRMAQERYRWLSPEALVEVGQALDYTPAYCRSVASFYDMFHLEPVGEHVVEVCTNICCGLRGAQGVLDAFESELGIRAGATTDDGKVTLRAVECLGGCAWPTVVSVDGRYRQNVDAASVTAIVAEVKGV